MKENQNARLILGRSGIEVLSLSLSLSLSSFFLSRSLSRSLSRFLFPLFLYVVSRRVSRVTRFKFQSICISLFLGDTMECVQDLYIYIAHIPAGS